MRTFNVIKLIKYTVYYILYNVYVCARRDSLKPLVLMVIALGAVLSIRAVVVK